VLYDLRARAIPAMSFATAANEIKGLAVGRNFNMENVGRNGTDWPTEGHGLSADENRWLHSDFKNVAFPYVYLLFKKFKEEGGLQ